MMLNELDRYKDIPLSDTDILKLMDGKATILKYSQLNNFKSLEHVLYPYGVTLILYENEPNFGHWTCLIKGPGFIEFFDPYGKFPDHWIDKIPQPFRTESGQSYKYLSHLFLDYEGEDEITYNEYKFQHIGDGIKNCGRWCVLRAELKELTLEEFKILFYGMYSDDVVTFLTSDLLLGRPVQK